MSWVLKYAFPVNQFSVYKIYGKDMFLANEDFSIRHWSIPLQKVIGFFTGHSGKITGIEYCPDLDLLASTSTDGTLIMWSGGRLVAKFMNKQRKGDTFGAPLYSICYAQKLQTLFVGANSEILAFRVRYEFVQQSLEKNASCQYERIVEAKPYHRIKLHSQMITKLLIAHDKLVSVSYDHTIGITRLDSLGVNKLVRLKMNQCITAITYDANQQILLVGSIDGKIHSLSKDGLIIEGADVFPSTAIVSIAPDSRAKLVWVISAEGEIKLLSRSNFNNNLTDYFDTLKERPIIGLTNYLYFGVHYEPTTQIMSLFLNEHYVLGFQYDMTAARVTINMKNTMHSICLFKYLSADRNLDPETSLSQSGHIKGVVETLKEGTYIIGGGQKTFIMMVQQSKYHFNKIKEITTHSKITKVAYSREYIAFGDDKGYLYYIQTSTMQSTKSAGAVGAAITSIQFLDQFILITTVNGSWHLITITEFPEPGEEKRARLMAHNGAINDSLLIKETGVLITAGSDGLLKSWTLGSDLKKLASTPTVFLTGTSNVLNETGIGDMREYGEIINIRSSKDKEKIVTSHSDHQIRVWTADAVTAMELLVTIPCAGCSITALELDKKSILAALDDKTIRVFDIDDGKLVKTFVGHKDTICSIGVSSGVDYYASSSWDGVLKLWSRDVEKLEIDVIEVLSKTPSTITSARKDKPHITTPSRPQTAFVSVIPHVSIYERRKQEIERRRRREKAAVEAMHRTPLYRDIKALTKLIEDSL